MEKTIQKARWTIAYDGHAFRRDLLAGLTVAAVSVPQAMAYALIAGIPPEYGLYTAIVVTALGSIFGSSSHLINGPTNAISLVVFFQHRELRQVPIECGVHCRRRNRIERASVDAVKECRLIRIGLREFKIERRLQAVIDARRDRVLQQAADVLCQDLTRKLNGKRPSDSYFRAVSKLIK